MSDKSTIRPPASSSSEMNWPVTCACFGVLVSSVRIFLVWLQFWYLFLKYFAGKDPSNMDDHLLIHYYFVAWDSWDFDTRDDLKGFYGKSFLRITIRSQNWWSKGNTMYHEELCMIILAQVYMYPKSYSVCFPCLHYLKQVFRNTLEWAALVVIQNKNMRQHTIAKMYELTYRKELWRFLHNS